MLKGTKFYHADGIHGSREYEAAGRWNGSIVLVPTAKEDEEVLIYTETEIAEGLADEWLSYTP
jgi:hypothetical protein